MGPDDLASLEAGAAEIVPVDGLAHKLGLGRPLRVKLGLDPTAAEITLGWAVVLHKLRQFQDAGHVAVLIVGDFTARVGDPSGRSDTRPRLSAEVVQGYADRMLDQFWRILDRERTEVRFNAEWLEGLGMEEILHLTASTTVARMLERDDFAKRYVEGHPISLMEFLYPLLQGWDSVAVEADVELGGIFAPADEIFGKLTRVKDELIPESRRLTLDFFTAPAEADRVAAGLANGSLEPWEEKRRLAREVVDRYHGAGAGQLAETRFLAATHEPAPDAGQVMRIPAEAVKEGRVWIPRPLTELRMAPSTSEARRLIGGRGVRLDGAVVEDPATEVDLRELEGKVLQVGSKKWRHGIRLVLPG